MKKIIIFTSVILMTSGLMATTDRRSMTGQWGPANRAVSVNPQTAKPSIKVETIAPAVKKDMRESEKKICTGNNLGIGTTFVWASRFSNSGNYSSMIEDIEDPTNNVCFVKVDLKSSDPRISVSDTAPVYYEFGRTITCGSWANADKIKQRILDAKKSARTWGTIAGAVGSAGVGVGAMELFGNKMIGGAVQGQKGLSGNEQLRSVILTLKEKDKPTYDQLKKHITILKEECNKEIWKNNSQKPDTCSVFELEMLSNL